jgi:hypothetical protein
MEGTKMIKKIIGGLMLGSFLLLGADNAFVGTWKLNVAKSKFVNGREAKELMLVVAVEGETATVNEHGTVGGQTYSYTYTVPTAGGPLNFTEGAPPAGLTQVSKRVDDRTVDTTGTMNGKQVLMQHVVVSADHKTMIARESGVDEKGAYQSVVAYDRQ